jgi:hypothetical protein
MYGPAEINAGTTREPGPAIAIAPKPNGVPLELDELRATNARLGEIVSELRDRISPVLRESVPTPGPMDSRDWPDPQSTVANAIREIHIEMLDNVHRLIDLVSRVDV